MLSISLSDNGSIALAKSILAEVPNAAKRAIRRSAIDAMRAVRAEIPRLVAAPNGRFAITKAEIRKRMNVRQVIEEGGLRVGLIISGKPIPQIKFSVSPSTPPSQKGVPVGNRKPITRITIAGNPRTGTPNRFLARMKSGHIGVFRRVRGVLNKAGTDTKIDEVYRPGVPSMVAQKEVSKGIQKRGSEVFQKALTRTVAAELKKITER